MVRTRGSITNDQSLLKAEKLAEAALKQYGLQDADFGLLRDGGKQLFCVSSSRGNFVLRIYNRPPQTDDLAAERRAERRSERAVRSQMRWLSDLRNDTRLPVPEPVPTLDGSLVGRVKVDSVPTSRTFALLRWIPGETKKGNLTLSETYSLGAHVARMHRYAESYSAPKDFARPRWDYDYLFGESSLLWTLGRQVFSNNEMRVLVSTAERIQQNLQDFGESSEIFGIIHGDLHSANFIAHNGVMYVIDFDECGYGYYLYDLTPTYLNLRRTHPESYETMRKALLDGYQSVRPLTDEELERLNLFVSMRLLARVEKVLTSLRRVPVDEILAKPAMLWKSHRLWEAMEFLSAEFEP